MKKSILSNDLNGVLLMLVSPSTIQAEVDINKALQEALLLNEKCPLSFMLSGDFTLDVDAQMREVEALR